MVALAKENDPKMNNEQENAEIMEELMRTASAQSMREENMQNVMQQMQQEIIWSF